MTRRIMALALILAALTAVAATAALADEAYSYSDTSADSYSYQDPNQGYYYVRTDNGNGLNVRDGINGNVVGSLKYGTRIYVETFTTPEWALITYRYNKPGFGVSEYAAWVSTRYLTRNNPGKFQPTPTAAPATPTYTGKDQSRLFADMNNEFKTAVQVDRQFTVYARPSRASGWVNLRWAPSLEAERILTCPQNKPLTVLAETRNWYQVKDPVTGMVGFITKKFVSK